MRVLVVSDLHYGLAQYDWLLAEARHFDLVVIAGDLLDYAGSVDRRAQIVVVQKYLDKLQARVPVVVVSGNHDLTGVGAHGEKVADWLWDGMATDTVSDGGTLEVEGALITACPWWDWPETQAQIGAQLQADAARGVRPWIWAYHAPPEESPVAWSGSRYFGDGALSKWIGMYQPNLVLAGHVHEAPFVSGGGWAARIGTTWVFNAGRQVGDLPSHIIFDLSAGKAAWFSFEGAEEVTLDRSDGPVPIKGLPEWLPAGM